MQNLLLSSLLTYWHDSNGIFLSACFCSWTVLWSIDCLLPGAWCCVCRCLTLHVLTILLLIKAAFGSPNAFYTPCVTICQNMHYIMFMKHAYGCPGHNKYQIIWVVLFLLNWFNIFIHNFNIPGRTSYDAFIDKFIFAGMVPNGGSHSMIISMYKCFYIKGTQLSFTNQLNPFCRSPDLTEELSIA